MDSPTPNLFLHDKKPIVDEDVDEKASPDTKSEIAEFDGIHDGLVFPTDKERETLRRVSDSVPWNAYRELR